MIEKMSERNETSLREQILGLPPSGLKLDGNLSVQECEDIFNYLEERGIESANEKIAYLEKVAISSEDEYLKNIGVTNETLDKVIECIQPRQDALDSTKRQNESFEKVGNYLRNKEINRDIVQEGILKESKNRSGVQRRNFHIAIAAVVIAVLSLIFVILTYFKM